jgi:hypothetical protein
MNSDRESFFNRLCDTAANARDSLGQDAMVVIGILLAAGILVAFLAGRWILRGGLSRSLRDIFAQRQAIEQYLKER